MVNGALNITATAAAPGSNPLNLPYNSGLITTFKSFSQLYGYFEVSADLPSEAGLWPAFWMMPVNGQPGTEIDIFELLGIDATTLHASTHSSITANGTTQAISVANTSTGFHTYGVDWEPTTTTFYMDGKAIASAPTPSDANVPMYMLLNLAVGAAGSWPGAANAATFKPATMQIDYVRAYATVGTVGTGNSTVPTATAALPSVIAAAATASAGKGSITVSTVHQGQLCGPQAGMGVALLNAAGQVVATGVTGSTGLYTFTGLAGGSYQVRYLPPGPLALQSGSQANVTTGLTAAFTLGSGQNLSITHEDVISTAYLGGSVLLASAPQGGVTVSLLNSAGTVATTTTTAADGTFSFYAVAGTYTVKYTTPAGEGAMIGSHANPTTGISPPITLVSGQAFQLTPEVFVVNPATLTGQVVYTTTNTIAKAGVTVTLLSSTGNVIATTTTNGTGVYSFTGVPAGSYQVQYTAPTNTAFSSASPADPISGITPSFVVAPGQSFAMPIETLIPKPAALTGTVLFANGTPTGEANVTITLLSSAGNVLAITLTNNTGAFSFNNLTAGTYQVKYTTPTSQIMQGGPGNTSTGLTSMLTLATGQTLALAAESMAGTLGTITGSALLGAAPQAGVTVALLNSTGATIATTITNGSGAYNFTGLATGYYQMQFLPPAGEMVQGGAASATTGKTVVFGVTAGATRTMGPVTLAPANATLTGSVLFAGAGQSSVAVALLNSAGAVIANTTSGSNGAFSFGQLSAGNYQLAYTAPAGEMFQAGDPANINTGVTGTMTLAANQAYTAPAEHLAPAYATLTGSVLFAGAGQPGVAVALRNGAGAVVATTASDINGAFSFGQLAAGSYALAYTAPAGESFQAGDPADSATGITGAMTLLAGQTYTAPAEHLLLTPVSLTMSGSHVALTKGDGPFIVTGSPGGSALTLGNGDQNVTLGGFFNTVTLGNGNDVVTLTGPGQILHVGNGAQALTLNGNFGVITLGDTPAGQTSTVTANGAGETVTGGNGAITVAVTAGNSTVALGNGNDTVKMIGSRNTVTVGTGNSVIDAGTNSAIVHAAGGNVTVTIAGQSNLVDIGPGNGVINAGASHADTFMLNGANQGLTIINGFSSNGDVLNLARTLTGTAIANDLSNISQYLSSSVSGGNTTLSVIGGSGAPSAFAVLNNTATSISQLVAGHQITTT